MKKVYIILLIVIIAVIGLCLYLSRAALPISSQKKTDFSWENGEMQILKRNSWAPRVYTLSNGNMIAGYETGSGIYTCISTDGGKSWSEESLASFHPTLNCANVNLFQDGESLYLAYRATGDVEGGFYTSLQVSVSTDNGKSWEKHSTVIENLEASGQFHGVWEPYLNILKGELTCFYANDSRAVTSLQNIEYKVFRNGEWTDQTIVSEGKKHNSRDGMPVWMQLENGVYVCVIESSKYRGVGYPFVLQMLFSEDGTSWSEPVDIYKPTTYSSKASAPGIVELPTGQLVISFQTDEDVDVKGDSTSVMKTIVSDGTDIFHLSADSFSPSESVFGKEDGGASVWTGLWYHNDCLYAAAGTRLGSAIKTLQIGQ